MDDSEEYGDLLALEALESLLEELEEAGAKDDLDPASLPADLADRVNALDVHSLLELRGRIADLHTKLDAEDDC
jgi:hypothetical protein